MVTPKTHLRDATNETPPPGTPAKKTRWEPPEWLSAPGKTAFRRILTDLESSFPEVLGRLDVPALAMLSEHYAIAQAAARAMRGDGNVPVILEVDEAHRDRRRKTPAWQVFREATTAFAALGREFGLTLAAREKLELDAGAPSSDADDEDDFDASLG